MKLHKNLNTEASKKILKHQKNLLIGRSKTKFIKNFFFELEYINNNNF